MHLKDVNPNTTFYSYYFFPRALRRVDAVLFLCKKVKEREVRFGERRNMKKCCCGLYFYKTTRNYKAEDALFYEKAIRTAALASKQNTSEVYKKRRKIGFD